MPTAPTTPTVPDMIRRATGGAEFEKGMAIQDFHLWTADPAEAVRLATALAQDPALRAIGATVTVNPEHGGAFWFVNVTDPRRTCQVHEPDDPACSHSDACFDG